MDLDIKAEALNKQVMITKSLDCVTGADPVTEKIYEAVFEEAGKIEGIVLPSRVVPSGKNKKYPPIMFRDLYRAEGEEFVRALYKNILLREADSVGLKNYSEALVEKRLSRDDVFSAIALSAEADRINREILGIDIDGIEPGMLLKYEGRQFVEKIYYWVLGRRPDEEGLNVGLKSLEEGVPKEIILYRLKDSEEGRKRKIVLKGLERVYRKKRIKYRLKKTPVIGKAAVGIYDLFGGYRKKTDARIGMLKRETEEIRQETEVKLFGIRQETEVKLFGIRQETDTQLAEIKQKTAELLLHINDLNTRAEKSEKHFNTVLKEKDEEIRELRNALNSDISARLDGIGTNLRNNNILIEKHEGLLESYNSDKAIIQDLFQEVSKLRVRMKEQENRPSIAAEYNRETENNGCREPDNVKKPVHDTYYSIDYFDFENRFRGSREHVKKVQEIYVPFFSGCKNVIDLGCGRGEFTELLTENGIGVTGIDLYEPYIESMKILKLNAVCTDALEYLRKQDSIDGLFMGQVVEHMDISMILEIMNLAKEKLTEGSYMIMETPNPTSLAIFTESFYMDPSHNKPIHPRTLQYLAEKTGFGKVDILFTESSKMPVKIPELTIQGSDLHDFNEAMKKVENMLYGSQDYAIIARK